MDSLCIFACSDQFQLPEKGFEFVRVIQHLCHRLDITLTHFDFALNQDENGALSNEGNFDAHGLKHLKRALTEKPIYQLALWSDYSENPYYNLLFELIDKRRFDNYKYAYVQFPMHYLGAFTSSGIFSLVSSTLSEMNRVGQLDYAMVTTMDSSIPASYFRGIFTTNLSDNEALNLATWENKFFKRKTELRDLYWGNLLGSGHLSQVADSQAFIIRLEALIGTERITTIDDALYFMLPSPKVSSDPVADAVKSLLEELDLLMQPDEQAIEMVNHSLTRLYARKKRDN
jgi:hypothetical protein